MVKTWLIPECKVKSVSVGGRILWQMEQAPDVPDIPTGDTVIISGSWELNDVPSLMSFSVQVNFDSSWQSRAGYPGCEHYHTIRIDRGGIQYIGHSRVDIAYDVNGWEVGDKVISFVGEQVVSKEFYEWLNANATKINDGEVRFMDGWWKLIKNPDFDELPTIVSIYGAFMSNDYYFGLIEITKDGYGDTVVWYRGGDVSTSQVKVYDAPTAVGEYEWKNERYRALNFGNGAFVDKEFYEWLHGLVNSNLQGGMVESEDSEVNWG